MEIKSERAKKDKFERITPDDDISVKERRLLELINGAAPRNEAEQEMVKQIKAIKNSGRIIDIPFDW